MITNHRSPVIIVPEQKPPSELSSAAKWDVRGRRLFFALWPDPVLREQMVEVGARLPHHGGRPHHAEDLHVTLVFLGAIRQDQLDCVLRVGDAVRGEPFALELDQIGYWPRPRIPWLGPSEVPGPLSELVGQLQSGLKTCGFEPEKRRYRPHVTLARKAGPVPTDVLGTPLIWTPGGFVLAASHSGPTPPRYEVLRRWALGS